MVLGFGQTIEGLIAQRRMAGAPLEVFPQLMSEMRVLRKSGAPHDIGKCFVRSQLSRSQFLNGVTLQFNRHCCHEQSLLEKRASFKGVDLEVSGGLRPRFSYFTKALGKMGVTSLHLHLTKRAARTSGRIARPAPKTHGRVAGWIGFATEGSRSAVLGAGQNSRVTEASCEA